jgi:hypothetical protein
MSTGIISFESLLRFVKKNSEIPHRQRDAAVFGQYQELFMKLITEVPVVAGWYFWVGRSDNPDHGHVYIGQAQSRKTASLHNRLEKELHVEYVGLWSTIHGDNAIVDFIRKYSKYETQIRRAARKWGATHVLWYGEEGLTKDQLNFVENKLITIYEPRANKKKPRYMHEYPALLENVVKEFNALLPNAA